MTVKGRVVGPDGQPVPDAWIISRVILSTDLGPHGWVWRGQSHDSSVKSGRFELHGLDPDAEVPVYFLDPKHKLGATARSLGQVGGRRTGHRPARALRHGPSRGSSTPAASRVARHRRLGPDHDGRHTRPYRGEATIRQSASAADDGCPCPDRPDQLRERPTSDAQGRIVFPALIPGATYRIYDRNGTTGHPAPQGIHRQARRDARPGRYPDRETSSVIETHPTNFRASFRAQPGIR